MATRNPGAHAKPLLTPAQLEELYSITLSEEERTWLTTSKDLLGFLERQCRFLLGIALEPRRCPACTGIICKRSACPAWDPRSGTNDSKGYICPLCTARLEWQQGLVAGEHWFTLAPGQIIEIGKGPIQPASAPQA